MQANWKRSQDWRRRERPSLGPEVEEAKRDSYIYILTIHIVKLFLRKLGGREVEEAEEGGIIIKRTEKHSVRIIFKKSNVKN